MNRTDLIGQAAEAIERTIGGFGLDIDGSAAAAVNAVLSAVADYLADFSDDFAADEETSAWRALRQAIDRIRALIEEGKSNAR